MQTTGWKDSSMIRQTKTVTLRQGQVILRQWQIEDAGWYVDARDEEVFTWTTERSDLTLLETEQAIQCVNENDTVFSFAIADSANDQLLGNIALMRDETDSATGEVMYWLASQARGRGVATTAVQLLAEWAFAKLGFEHITLQTHIDNVRSQRIAERLGFQRTTLRNENVLFTLTANRGDSQ